MKKKRRFRKFIRWIRYCIDMWDEVYNVSEERECPRCGAPTELVSSAFVAEEITDNVLVKYCVDNCGYEESIFSCMEIK